MKIMDGFRSLIGNLGNPDRDKSASLQFTETALDDNQLMIAFGSNWITKKIVALPAKDALKKWRCWSGDTNKAVMYEEERLNVEKKLLEALIKARLFGGAGIFIGTDQDASEPLNPEMIQKGGVKYLTVLTRRELIANELEQDAMSEYYGKPVSYQITGSGTNETIHPSHLILLDGDMQPDTWGATGVNNGWGVSVVKAAYDSIRNAGGAFANVASLIYEAKIDVIKVPNLMDNIGSEGYENNLLKRFALAATNKGINGTLILDKDEDYDSKSASFGQLPEIMAAFAMHCAAAASIPYTHFMGQSATGLNATGEGDMDVYYDMLAAYQKLEIGPAMRLFDECLVRSAIGNWPDDLSVKWNPLQQMDEKEIAEIEKLRAESVKILSELTVDVMPLDAIYEQQRRAGLFEDTDITTFDDYKAVITEQNTVAEEI